MKPSASRFNLHILTLLSLLLSMAGGALAVTPAYAAVGQRYAKPTPDGVNTGLCDSWGTACTLERALMVAGEVSASAVWAKEGTYMPDAPRGERTATITLVANLSLYGGFAGTETSLGQRNPTTHVTILSGDIGTLGNASDNSYHVVTGASGATIDGFTITSGNSNSLYPNDSGGGIFNTSGSLTVANILFSGNIASNGGGIYNDTGTLTVEKSIFSGNNSDGYAGGAICNIYGTLNISETNFSANSSFQGGSLFSGGTLNITTSTLSGNGASLGGGIYNFGTLNIINSTLSGNSASGGSKYGGGIYNDGVLNITNSTFSGNSSEYGGGVYFKNGSADIINSTFSGNSASSGFGSGIYNAYSDPVTLRNTIVANSASGTTTNCLNSIINGGNNIEDGTTCGWGAVHGSMSSTNPKIGPLANYGGPTSTFVLLAGSPAIDGVSWNSPNSAPSTDQRGVERPQGAGYDIGAFESQGTPPASLFSIFLPLVRR